MSDVSFAVARDVTVPPDSREAVRAFSWLVPLTYAILVILMWAPHTLFSGLGYETGFPYNSETTSWLRGFLYVADPMRIHTNTFYHFSYLLGEVFGVGGSYVPYQIVQATLWWARGMLVYALVTRLVDDRLFAYVAGALVLVHAADGALQWAGQINQLGYIFWMLMAAYVAVRAIDAERPIMATVLGLAAPGLLYMSLWSYESQLPLVCVFPILLFWTRRSARRRVLWISALWYPVIAAYVSLTLQKYAQAGTGTYQQAVMRTDWGVQSLLNDWWFNVSASLSFAHWTRVVTPESDRWLGALCCGVFAAVGLWIGWRQGKGQRSTSVSTLVTSLALGLTALILSFPVYLLLSSARGLWRTQLLSGIGAALTFTAAAALIAAVLPRRLRSTAIVVLATVVVWNGSVAALGLGQMHRRDWEKQRRLMRNVLATAPSLKPETVVIFTNMPRNEDPFGDAMWLDTALHLVYPGIPVAAAYYFDDGTAAPGLHSVLAYDRWLWEETGPQFSVGEATLSETVVLSVQPGGRVTVSSTLPNGLCKAECSSGAYAPLSRIERRLSERAVRRYRLDAD